MNWHPGAFTLFCTLTIQSPSGDEIVNEASRMVDEAEASLAEGVPEKILTVLETLGKDPVWDQAPKDLQLRAWRAVGLAHDLNHDPEAAAQALKRAAELAGDSSSSFGLEISVALARVGLEMKDAVTARQALGRLGKKDLSLPQIAVLLGLCHFLSGDSRQAEEVFSNVPCPVKGPASPLDGPSASESDAAQASFYLGVICFDRGERETALKHFELAAKLDPQDYYTQVYIARSLLDLGREGEVLRRLESLAAPFQTPEVRSLEGRAQLRKGRYAEAAAFFGQALEGNPRSTEALMGLGTALRLAGKKDEARKALERFQALHDVESEQQRKVNALSQAVERNPKDAKAFEEMALLSLEEGDLDATERNAWRALLLDSARLQCRLALAQALARTGRYGAAAAQYQKILRQNPDQKEARQQLDELVRKHSRKRP